jgi:uncharacterized protein
MATSMDSPLDAVAVRVLGSLIEKESTTPDNYPLTLNALTAACNQISNREPVMDLDEATVLDTLKDLSRRSLVREVYRNDSRAKRYRHTMVETMTLHPAELAVLGTLMLRGPQTTGEIRTRAARLFDFPDLARVELTLQSLMTLTTPLVVQLPRRPGQKEVRYAHLLSGEPAIEAEETPVVEKVATPSRVETLEAEVAALRSELADLRTQFDDFKRQFS